jgi:two-component system, OmpR family, sensor histidine kinase CpxA
VRLERPVHTPEQLPVDVAALLATIAADVAIEAEARGCRVELEAERELWVSGDEELLRSAFENVIRNAVRFSPAQQSVRLRARRVAAGAGHGERVQVTVQDRGPGVPDKDLGLIFEPFYRVDAARGHGASAGEGLGLAIASRAVTLHGGEIEARNLLSGGLSVSISLPARSAARLPAPSTPALA